MASEYFNVVTTQVWVEGELCDHVAVELFQSMTDHHRFEVEVNYRHEKPGVWAVGPDEIFRQLGKTLTITMTHQETQESNEFTGVITDIEIIGTDGDQGSVILKGGSPTLLLDRDPAMECYVDHTLQNIVSEVLDRSGVDIELENKPEYEDTIPYAARYRETSYAFLARTLASYGEWFYYDGQRLIVGNPHLIESSTVSYDIELRQVRLSAGVRNLNVELFDYNAQENDYFEDSPASVDGVNLYMQVAQQASEPFYPTTAKLPAIREVHSEKDIMEVMKNFHSRNYSRTSEFTASCKTCAIRVGELVSTALPDTFEEAGLKDLGRYRVLEVCHRVNREGTYSNEFRGLSGMTEHLPSDHIVFPTAYPQPATVIDNQDPKKQGRVRVRWFWQDASDTDAGTNWIRVQAPDAGNSERVGENRGLVFIPEVDDQVMVGFEYGNPDRPFVMGSLFHKDNAGGAAEDNDIKTIITRSGHMLRFDDNEDDGWGITITDANGNTIHLDTKEKNIQVTAPETITLSAKNIELVAQEDIKLNAEQNIEIASKEKSTYSADGTMDLYSSDDMTINTSGAMSAVATKDVDIQGQNVVATGKVGAELKGAQTLVEGKVTTVQGASNKLEVV